MQDETAILDFLRLHPDDRVAYLAYADWLDEHQRHDEAEFIRVEVELDTPKLPHPRYHELKHRRDELFEGLYPSQIYNFLNDPGRIWKGTSSVEPKSWFEIGTRWGLTYQLNLGFQAPSSSSLEPIQSVLKPGHWIGSLKFTEDLNRFDQTHDQDPFLPVQTLLECLDSHADQSISERFQTVRELTIKGTPSIVTLERIGKANLFPKLSKLTFDHMKLEADEFESLFRFLSRNTFQSSLQSLNFEDTPIDESTSIQFCKWACVTQIKQLRLSWCYTTRDSLRNLLSLDWPALEELTLSHIPEELTADDFSSSFPMLHSITFDYHEPYLAQLTRNLLKKPWVKQLRKWTQPDPIDAEVIQELNKYLSNEHFRELEGIVAPVAGDSTINEKNLNLLLNAEFCRNLESLFCQESHLRNPSLVVISSSACSKTLQSLFIHEHFFSVDNLNKWLVANPHLNLHTLGFSSLFAEDEDSLIRFLQSYLHVVAFSAPWYDTLAIGMKNQRSLSDQAFLSLVMNLHQLNPIIQYIDFDGMVSDDAIYRLGSIPSFLQSTIELCVNGDAITHDGFKRFLSNPSLRIWRGVLRMRNIWDSAEALHLIHSCPYLHPRPSQGFLDQFRTR
jgi:uncharacterized protein (TIGR02996 family)